MTSADATATDFYERLGIDQDASREEIRKAYAVAVREFPPERNPEEFERIREAYETLYDKESRAEYDATSDPAVEEALESGQEALLEQEYDGAIDAFKRALVLEPNAHFIRNLLGVALLHAEREAEALKQFKQLTSEFPENHLYWAHRATSEHELEKWDEAETHYRKAIDLEPEESSAYEGLATLLADQDRFDEAEDLVERGIRADDEVNFDDISLFFQLLTLRLRQGDVEGVEKVADRVESILSEDWQRPRVAYRFASLAQSLVEVQAYDLALTIAETSESLAPNDDYIAEFTESIRQNHTIIDQWEEFKDDPKIRDNLKATYTAALQEYLDVWGSKEVRDNTLGQLDELLQNESITAVIENGRRRSLHDEIVRVEEEYPALLQLFAEGFTNDMKQMSAGADAYVWLTCPHCGSQARAQDESGQYGCPDCERAFLYDRSNARVTAETKGCVQSIAKWIGYGFLVYIFLAVLQTC